MLGQGGSDPSNQPGPSGAPITVDQMSGVLSSLGLNPTQAGQPGTVWTPGLVPNAQDYGQILGPMGIISNPNAAPTSGTPMTWSPGFGDAFPYVTGAMGAVVGGPAGAMAGYAGGKALSDANPANPNSKLFGGSQVASNTPAPAQDFTNANLYGYGNFSPTAQQQAGYFNQLGQSYGGMGAPQLQRTSVDWTSMGNGQGVAPLQPQLQQPGLPSSMTQGGGQAPAQTGSQGSGAAGSFSGAGGLLGGTPTGGGMSPMATGSSPPPPQGIRPGLPGGFNPQNGGTSVAQAAGPNPGSTLIRSADQPTGPGGVPYGPGGIPAMGQYANPVFQQQQQARNQQEQYINELQNGINGTAPSLAQLQLRQGVDANIASQMAMAASGGPGSAAFAQRNAMNNAANANQQLAGQSAALRAQEYQNALGQMGNATSALRAADLQSTGMSYQNALAQAQLEQQQNSQQANLQMQQNALNLQGQLGMYGLGQNVTQQDLASRMNYMNLMAQKYANDRGLAQNQAQFQTNQNNLLLGTALNSTGGFLSSLVKSQNSGNADEGD